MHVAVEDHDPAICEALPSKALKKSFLAPKPIEEQAEAFPVFSQINGQNVLISCSLMQAYCWHCSVEL